MTRLEGRRVLITGAARGLGEEIARWCRQEGADVALLDRDPSVEATAARLGATGDPAVGRVLPFVVDVTDADAVAVAVAGVVEALGGLDGLVNNAGVGTLGRLEDTDDRMFERIVRVNLYGTFHLLRACAPHLLSARGSVVNVASLSGVRPTIGEAVYSAAKAAVIALGQAAAAEWAPEVRVNSVSPGFIRTDLNSMLTADPVITARLEAGTPLARLGDPADVAGVVGFLLSDEAAYLTGQNVVIDGGTMLGNRQTDPVLGPMLRARPESHG